MTMISTIGAANAAREKLPELPALRDAINTVVGRVFYGTLLQESRRSATATHRVHGGRGEDVFGAQLDAIHAERLGRRSRGGVGEALYRHLIRQQARVSEASPPTASTELDG